MKVSVVIPVYNVELYVEDCLRSVMDQTLQDIEIICVEDAGQDNSIDIIRRLMEEDSRISLFVNDKNMGLASTRNRGLGLAKGKYVYFLDSDDMIRPTALKELFDRAEAENLDTCIFSADFIFEDESLKEKFGTNPAKYKGEYPDVMKGKDLYIAWMKVWDWMPSQPRYFYRRDFLMEKGIRYIDGMLHEDETFAFDVLMKADRVRVIDEAYFIRRFRPSSIMSSGPTMKNVEACIRILKHVTDYEREEVRTEKNPLLIEAIEFYKGKIAADVARKYSRVKESGKGRVLFACSSYYQVLIALSVAFTEKIKIDLVLEEHGIETADRLAERLQGLVDNVYVCKTSPEVDPYEEKQTADDEVLAAKLTEHVEEMFGDRDISEYTELHVFWDLGYIGTYLNIKNIGYILHEDSLDSYKKIRANRPNYQYIFDMESCLMHKGVVPFGYSPCCMTVEVNDTQGIEIPAAKVHERGRAEMMNNLSPEDKKRILKAFCPEEIKVDGAAVLLLTDPFAVTGRLPDRESQKRLYQELVEKYVGNEKLMIKAHPRDDLDYKSIFPEAVVIEKNMPMEVMNFDESICFDTAITVTSSAINGLKYVKNRIYLGQEYLNEFKKN